jgi:hypothetical protein
MCDSLIERLECTIPIWSTLYQPLYQFGGPKSFKAKECGKN